MPSSPPAPPPDPSTDRPRPEAGQPAPAPQAGARSSGTESGERQAAPEAQAARPASANRAIARLRAGLVSVGALVLAGLIAWATSYLPTRLFEQEAEDEPTPPGTTAAAM